MIMRQMTQADYECVVRYLRENGQADAFGLTMELDGAKFFLRLRLDCRRRVHLVGCARLWSLAK